MKVASMQPREIAASEGRVSAEIASRRIEVP
jgi:hypothetical protein